MKFGIRNLCKICQTVLAIALLQTLIRIPKLY